MIKRIREPIKNRFKKVLLHNAPSLEKGRLGWVFRYVIHIKNCVDTYAYRDEEYIQQLG